MRLTAHAAGFALSFVILLQASPLLRAQESCKQTSHYLVNAPLLPAHTIKYTDQETPEWKINWDRARTFFAQKKYVPAQRQYELLLQKKNNVELARWEFVNLLIQQNKWEKASAELAALLNLAPQRKDYQLAEAEILLGMGDVVAAEKRFATLYALYDQRPHSFSCHADTIRVVQGYITALEKQDKFSRVIPLLEKLIELTPEDVQLQKKYAASLVKTHQIDKALLVLNKLKSGNKDDIEVLNKLAELYSLKNNSEQAATCWQQLIGIDPDNLQANKELVAYYKDVGNLYMELKHTERLFSLMPRNAELLQQLADRQRLLHRPDLALDSYNRLVLIAPGNTSILAEREKVLDEVAEQLLVFVHNNGTGKLWTTLVRSPKDRQVVYKTMADILRVNGESAALLEVLQVLLQEEPQNQSIVQEIHLLQKQQTKHNFFAASQKVHPKEQDIISQ